MKLPQEDMVKWQHDLGSTSDKRDSMEAKGPCSKRLELFTSRSPRSRGNTCQNMHGMLIASMVFRECPCRGEGPPKVRTVICAGHCAPFSRSPPRLPGL